MTITLRDVVLVTISVVLAMQYPTIFFPCLVLGWVINYFVD